MAKKMTDAEQLEYEIKAYRALDANQDGSVSLEEFTKDTEGFIKELRESVWHAFNQDGNSGLSPEEYLDSKNVKSAR